MDKLYIQVDNRTYIFNSIKQLFMVCQLGGFNGLWEDFTALSLKEVQPYMVEGYRKSPIHH